MKRDLDLIREILIEVEKQPVNQVWRAEPLLGYTREEVVYHVSKAKEQRLLEAIIPDEATAAIVTSLTFSGHDFLDAARSDQVWAKAKDMVMKATGTLTLQALTIALPRVIEHLMKS